MSSEQETPARVLGDYFDLQRGATYKSALLGQPGPVLLGLASIDRNGGFRADNLKTYGGDSPEKLLLTAGDMYVSLKDVTQSGDLLGAVARVPSCITCGRLTQDTVKLIPKPVAEPALSYLFWLLRTPPYRAYCRQHAMGTTNLSMSREALLAYEVPPFTTARRHLIRVLEGLDDKIKSNRRLAEALLDCAAMQVEHAVEGAKPRSIYDVATVTYGAPFSSKLFGPPGDGRPLIRIRDLAGQRPGVWTSEVLRRARLVQAGDIVVGMDAEFRAHLWAGEVAWLNQRVCVFDPAPGVSRAYLLEVIKTPLAFFEQTKGGTTVIHLGKRDIDSFMIPRISDDDMAELTAAADPLVYHAVALRRECLVLEEVRDAVLPKLVSGQIRVPAEDADPVSLAA